VLRSEAAHSRATFLNILFSDLKLLICEAKHVAMGFRDFPSDCNFLYRSNGNFYSLLATVSTIAGVAKPLMVTYIDRVQQIENSSACATPRHSVRNVYSPLVAGQRRKDESFYRSSSKYGTAARTVHSFPIWQARPFLKPRLGPST